MTTTQSTWTDEQIKFAYTSGDCWVLALHMAKITGLEAVVLGEFDGQGDNIYEQFDWHHAFIWDPETKLCYDVDGVWALDDMFEAYGADYSMYSTEIVDAHPEHFKTNTYEMFEVPVAEAERVMRQEIEKAGYELPMRTVAV